MTARPLAPFLISFALLLLLVSSTTLPAANTPVTADEVRSRLLSALAQDLAAHFNAEGDLQLDPLRAWASSANSEAWSIAVAEYPNLLASSMLVRVRLTGPGGVTQEEMLACRAQLWRDAWVARTPFERGAAFDPASCDFRRIDGLRDRETLSTSLTRANDWIFLRPVPAGRLVTWRDLGRRALVRKGDVIEVAAVDRGLQITLKALAMQDGGQGETVRVRNLDSKREFAALVTSENRAQVRF